MVIVYMICIDRKIDIVRYKYFMRIAYSISDRLYTNIIVVYAY